VGWFTSSKLSGPSKSSKHLKLLFCLAENLADSRLKDVVASREFKEFITALKAGELDVGKERKHGLGSCGWMSALCVNGPSELLK
jgi:hypothetical protein